MTSWGITGETFKSGFNLSHDLLLPSNIQPTSFAVHWRPSKGALTTPVLTAQQGAGTRPASLRGSGIWQLLPG